MSLSITLRVHRVQETTQVMAVEVQGTVVRANVPCLEVELVDDKHNASMTLKFVGDEIAPARSAFQADEEVVLPIE